MMFRYTKIKNLRKVANESKKPGWTQVWFNIDENAVYTTEAEDRVYIGCLIRENTPKEIENYINRIMNM